MIEIWLLWVNRKVGEDGEAAARPGVVVERVAQELGGGAEVAAVGQLRRDEAVVPGRVAGDEQIAGERADRG